MIEKDIDIKNIIINIKKQLKDKYPSEEINSFVNIIFEHLLHFSNIDIHLSLEKKLDKDIQNKIFKIVDELKKEKPIQYILSNAYFYDLKFKVSPGVLIPRQETEELVDWIIKDNNLSAPKILDIGTGTGCIAIALNKNISSSEVFGIDVSDAALKIANFNNKQNNTKVEFFKYDILKQSTTINSKYDIIVSNPPYVTPADREKMLPNVSDHEPPLALFVDEDDPLLFYREIIDFSTDHLLDGGSLYFECNEGSAREVTEMLKRNGFKNIELRKDMQGKERMVLGVRC
ncbi:MAG: peptide chain release factor N(5)-glutamine methyltransferase [Bacteroidota bacterium]|nr:peptide chain release factor N(5)-glutamine methyltransferase [Bacteroidota bacterium]